MTIGIPVVEAEMENGSVMIDVSCISSTGKEMELESIGESIPILISSSDNILTPTTTFLRCWFTVHLSKGFKACLESFWN